MRVVKKSVSSSNNIYYIQRHHFTQQTMLNQWLYHTVQYLEPNSKSKGGDNHHPLGGRCHNKQLDSLKVKLVCLTYKALSTSKPTCVPICQNEGTCVVTGNMCEAR